MQENYRNYETEELVKMYQSTKGEELLSEIIRRNNGLIHQWARDYKNIPNMDEEDLVQEGVIACWKAVGYYNPAKGVKFVSCLKGFVKQRYNLIYNQETRKKRFDGYTTESYEYLVEMGVDGLSLTPNKLYTDTFTAIEIQEFLLSLQGRTKEVMAHLLAGYSKSDTARILGITPASTSFHIKKIQTSLNVYMGA